MVRKLKLSETPSILKQLVAKQDNKCAVCGQYFSVADRAVLDHCHDTGFIRGALHNSCNGAEGRVKSKGNMGHKGVTSAEYIIGLGKYLETHKTPKYPLIYHSHMTPDEKRLDNNRKARVKRAKAK